MCYECPFVSLVEHIFTHDSPQSQHKTIIELVGGLEHVLFSHSAGNVIIPIDDLIFFRGIGIPPTRERIINIKPTCRAIEPYHRAIIP